MAGQNYTADGPNFLISMTQAISIKELQQREQFLGAYLYEEDSDYFPKAVPSGTGTEAGFFVYEVDRSGRGVYRKIHCRAFKTVNGKKYLCTYEVRSDHWLETMQKTEDAARKKRRNAVPEPGLGAHRHQFEEVSLLDLVQDEGTFHRERPLQCVEMYEKMAIFAAKNNVALKKIVSDDFFQIVWTAAEYYAGLQHNTSEKGTSAAEILRKIGVDRMRDLIITTSQNRLSKSLREAALKKFVCVCLDAGQVRKRHWLDFMVCFDRTEIPFDIHDTENLDSDGYKDHCVHMLKKLFEEGVRVSCFVGDGLPAQINALDSSKPTSFQHTYSNAQLEYPELREVMFFPCWIHRVQLVFRHIYKESQRDKSSFHKYVDDLHKLASRLRKPDAIKRVGATCPAPIETRWLFSFDIAKFVYNRKDCIGQFLQGADRALRPVVEVAENMMRLLEPLRALTVVLSSKGCTVGCVFPYIEMTCERLDALDLMGEWKSYRDFIRAELITVTIGSKEGDMLLAAYYMTLNGKHRYKPRSVRNSIGIEAEPLILPELLPHDAELNVDIHEEIDDEMVEDRELDDTLYEMISAPPVPKEPDPRMSRGPSRIQRGVEGWCLRQGRGKQWAAKAWRELYNFLEVGIETIPQHTIWALGDERLWNAITADDADYKHISAVAERVVIIPASEISCERAISLQGYIQTKYNSQSREDLLTAKLVHLCD